MNNFSIDYPKYHIARHLQKDFQKRENYSICIPLSRQQKYYDLLIFSGNSKKCLTIQVKSSRTYINTEIDELSLKEYHYTAWLKNFRTVNPYTDFYFIFISFPLFDTQNFRPKAGFGVKILVFDNSEMTKLLSDIKTTKSGLKDAFFGFGFNIDSHQIFGSRGFCKNPRIDFTDNSYDNKMAAMKEAIA